MSYENNVKVLHWVPDKDCWEEILLSDWSQFRGILSTPVGLPGLSGGIHYFIYCIHDGGAAISLIPHKYMLEMDGTIGPDNFAGLTKAERDDYHRLILTLSFGPGDEKRLNELRNKMEGVNDPPANAYNALLRALPKPPATGSLAETFLKELRYRQ